MRNSDYVLSHFLIRCRHLRDGSGRLVRFTALAVKRPGLRAGKFAGLCRLGLYIDPGIDKPAQGSLQARFLTEHGHIQPALWAVVVAKRERYQRVGKCFWMLRQGAFDGPAMPANRNRQASARQTDRDEWQAPSQKPSEKRRHPSISRIRYQSIPSASSGERKARPPGKVMCGTELNTSKPWLCPA